MEVANKWTDYEIIDMANGEKLERWGDVILIRPDPQIIWKERTFPNRWNEAHAEYIRSTTGGGSWKYKKKIPEKWRIRYNVGANGIRPNEHGKSLQFNIKPMGFKHTGLFPEQAVNWDWMMMKIQNAIKTTKGRIWKSAPTRTKGAESICIHRWGICSMSICRSICMSCG